mmetsp:Transcript_68869/g.153695  ORF Transcript_68869/g.153695 Transcript_68869/m.153695 type:complete len:231 (+) Transcript_68869:1078-1770(+)
MHAPRPVCAGSITRASGKRYLRRSRRGSHRVRRVDPRQHRACKRLDLERLQCEKRAERREQMWQRSCVVEHGSVEDGGGAELRALFQIGWGHQRVLEIPLEEESGQRGAVRAVTCKGAHHLGDLLSVEAQVHRLAIPGHVECCLLRLVQLFHLLLETPHSLFAAVHEHDMHWPDRADEITRLLEVRMRRERNVIDGEVDLNAISRRSDYLLRLRHDLVCECPRDRIARHH